MGRFPFFLSKTKQEISFLNDQHKTSLYTDNVPNGFPELQVYFSKKFSIKFISVSKQMQSKPFQRTGNMKPDLIEYGHGIPQLVLKRTGVKKGDRF